MSEKNKSINTATNEIMEMIGTGMVSLEQARTIKQIIKVVWLDGSIHALNEQLNPNERIQEDG